MPRAPSYNPYPKPNIEQGWIGIDNGVSGSVGWVLSDGSYGFEKTPVFETFNYQKKGAKCQRIDTKGLLELLTRITAKCQRVRAYLERPMVNPTRFNATASALRAMEATLIVFEQLKLSYEFIDSKQWQKKLTPGIKGAPALKAASLQIGSQLFPDVSSKFRGDADGILIAEWAKRIDTRE